MCVSKDLHQSTAKLEKIPPFKKQLRKGKDIFQPLLL